MTLRNELPVILIPDIRGNSEVFRNLKKYLEEQKESVYSWEDARWTGKFSHTTKIVAIAKDIADDILAKREKANLPANIPCRLVGYSFGCVLMTEVIKQLKDARMNVHAVAIDSPAVPFSQNYFQSNNESATNDLLKLIKLVALENSLITENGKLDVKLEQLINYKVENPIKVSEFIKLPIRKQFERLKDQFVIFITNDKTETMAAQPYSEFTKATQIILQNYVGLAEYKATVTAKPDKLLPIMTSETLKKYGSNLDSNGGWGKFYELKAEDVLLPSTECLKELIETPHTELLDAKHGPLVANAILDFFRKLSPNSTQSMNTASDTSSNHSDSSPPESPKVQKEDELEELEMDFSSSAAATTPGPGFFKTPSVKDFGMLRTSSFTLGSYKA